MKSVQNQTVYFLLVNDADINTKNGTHLYVGNCKGDESGSEGGVPSIFFRFFVRVTYHPRLRPQNPRISLCFFRHTFI